MACYPGPETGTHTHTHTHTSNPLAHIYTPVLANSGQVPLMAEECKPNLSQSAKAIVDGTGRDEDIYFYL